MDTEKPFVDPFNIRLVRSALPAESLYSIFSIFGWQYALSAQRLFQHVSNKKSLSKEFSFFKSDWVDCEKLLFNLGIEFNKCSGMGKINDLLNCSNYWFTQQLKVCPICLEYGYHSHWFQLIDLICCPIHGCLLQNQCSSCGVLLPTYAFSRKLFNDPFICYSCKGPISGVAPNLVKIEEFRSHGSDMGFRFSDFEKWSGGFGEMNCLHKFEKISGKNQTFLYSKDFLNRQVGRFYHPIPFSINVLSSGLYFDLVCWRVQMFEKQERVCSGEMKYDRYNIVWRVFMRRIRYWILGGMSSDRLRELYHNYQVIDRDAVDLTKWNPREFALMLYRDMLGIWWTNSQKVTTDTALARLPHGTSLWNKRLPRIGLLYLLLANFAGLVVTIDYLSKSNKKLKLSAIRAMENKWAVSTFDYSPSGLATGVLAIPIIVGFPVKWSARIKGSLSGLRSLNGS